METGNNTNRIQRENKMDDINQINDVKRERMLRELASNLRDLVESGNISDNEANEWYNMKADQWTA